MFRIWEHEKYPESTLYFSSWSSGVQLHQTLQVELAAMSEISSLTSDERNLSLN